MARPVAWVGLALLAMGAGIFLWKTSVLGTPILPASTDDLWRVELEIDVRGSAPRGSVIARLPASGPLQTVFDESFTSGGLLFTIRTERGQRVGVWRGAIAGVHRVAYAFRIQLHRDASLEPPPEGAPVPPPPVSDTAGSGEIPVNAEAVAELLDRLEVPAGADDALARARTLFGFVADEIETAEGASDDALLVLSAREGNALGKARLLVTLLRAAGIPARLARGLRLAEPADSREIVFAEAWGETRWVPFFPTLGRMDRPTDLVVLARGAVHVVESAGVEALGYRYRVLRERLGPEEIAALMVPANPILGASSLYRLPLRTQAVLRVVLLLPLASLVVALFRNVIGLRTFGTFLPILLALALRGTGLAAGLAMVAAVVGTGLVGRLLLDRLRLLFVPRLCVLLCLVILAISALAVLGHQFESGDLLTGVLFPIVILTMLIERFSIVVSEEGFRNALVLLVNTLLVASCAYPLFHSEFLATLVFGYPELVLCVMGALVWIGGYTGYRVSELVRFRSFAADGAAGAT